MNERPRADEQRVVDPDTDTDHRGDLRRERRNIGEPREQGHDRETDADAEHRGHDRKAHREHGAERDQEDQDGGQDADRFALRLRLVGEHRAPELDLEVRGVRLFHQIAHVRGEVDRHVVGLHVELDLGVCDLAVGREELRPTRFVRSHDRRNVLLFPQLGCERLLDLVEDCARLHTVGRVRLEHEVTRVARTREVLLHDVERALRLRTRQRQRLQQIAARSLREHVDTDEKNDPRDDDPTPTAVTPRGQSREHGGRLPSA